MATNATEGLSPHEDDGSIADLDDRDVRALTEPMTVLPSEGRADGAGGLFLVVSHTGNQYLADTVTGACECPDAEYNLPTDDGRQTCKHVARAKYSTGRTAIPAWVHRDAVDDCLGVATDDGPRYAATDGGVFKADDDTDTDGCPDDCDCGEWNADSGLPCWPCWRDGFRLPPADAGK